MIIQTSQHSFSSTITVCAECLAEASMTCNEAGRLVTTCGHPANFIVRPNPAVAA